MQLDTPTLFACLTVAGFAGSAILLLFYRFWPVKSLAGSRSLALWAAGLFLAGCGTLLIGLRGTIPDGLSIIGANFLIILAIGLRRAGLAVLLGLRGHLWVFAIVATGWLVMCLFPPFLDSFLFRVNYVQSCLILGGLWMAAMVFFENTDKLHSARLLGMTILVECAAFAWFMLNQNLLQFPTFLSAFPEGFMTVYLVVLLFSTVMTIVLPPSMLVEKSRELSREENARNDVTGLSTRGAFCDDAQAWIRENRENGSGYSLILFDLDELKTVGEKYSPAMSDALLQLFARILKDTVGETAVAGHIGKNEFAVFLPETDHERTRLTAQSLCRQFGLGCEEASAGKLMISVSVGFVTASAVTRLGRVMETAERGLEKAGRQGKAQIVAVDLTTSGSARNSARKPAFPTQHKNAA
ncbi:GGDEF domain-containing protein [Roseibium sp.]|uniref:GGDEF domain-containing protein n=1 Tax=Roseibium sp. TaxID=1936156 RepID=UPI0032662CC5